MEDIYKPQEEKIYPRPSKEEPYLFPKIDKDTIPYISWENLSRAERIINVAIILFLIGLFIKFVL